MGCTGCAVEAEPADGWSTWTCIGAERLGGCGAGGETGRPHAIIMISRALESGIQELHNALFNTQNQCLVLKTDLKFGDLVEVGDGCRK